jgi:hypothetical protein
MKATAKCPKCGEFIETDCRGCINRGGFECAKKECSCELKDETEIQWNKIPENEKELEEVENE